jgi:hypothetical protein
LVKQNHVTIDSENIETFKLYDKYPSSYPNQSPLDPVLAKIGEA